MAASVASATLTGRLRVELDCSLSPEQVLSALRDEPWPFALTGRWAGGGAIVGCAPRALLAAGEDPFARLEDLPAPRGDARVGGGWFGWLGYGLGATIETLPPPPPRPAPLPTAHLAFYDHLLVMDPDGRWWFESLEDDTANASSATAGDAEAKRSAAGVAPVGAAATGRAAGGGAAGAVAAAGGAAGGVAAAGGAAGGVAAGGGAAGGVAAGGVAAAAGSAAERLERLQALLSAAPELGVPEEVVFAARAPGAAGHVAAVADCVERIAAGEIFQANLCLRLDATYGGSVIDLFARAAPVLRPAYGACFVTPWGGIASLSPELFLRREGRRVVTGPIKGTAPRGTDPAALQASAKDNAEHVMIVDLMRNDLGRVAEYGSVVAPAAPQLQPHAGVWHLVSEVTATLAPGHGDADLLRATFPPGSVTGAPKVQAMKVINALEATGREVYTGAIGYASPHAGLELNVAIRTFEQREDRLWLGVGGGIVADSDPQAELEEALVKARPLVAAIGATLAEPRAAAAPRGATEPGAVAASREDAGAGAAAVTGGAAEAGAAVLGGGAGAGAAAAGGAAEAGAVAVPGRDASVGGGSWAAACSLSRGVRGSSSVGRPDAALGVFETLLVRDGEPVNLVAHLDRLRRSVAALYDAELPALEIPRKDGAVRITYVPGTVPTVAWRPLPKRALPIVVTPRVLPGGLGAHKWADRTLLDAWSADGTTPLLLDADGTLLEAAWAAVLVRRDGRLYTPREDGRILPSTSRPPAEPVDLTLQPGDELFLSSSLAGLVPAVLAPAA